MARLSTFSIIGKGIACGRKCNSARDKREARAVQNRHRKLSMDAYYRPRLRGLVFADNWDADSMEGDDMPGS